jgi:hypothetical protein
MQNMATVLDGQGHAQEALEMLIKALSVEEEVPDEIFLLPFSFSETGDRSTVLW